MELDLTTLTDAYTYLQYQDLLLSLLEKNLTTGSVQSELLVAFTRLNISRMTRIDKNLLFLPEIRKQLQNLKTSLNLAVLTEGWCGDSAQTLPVINWFCNLSGGKLNLQIILRDDHPALMDSYLTNGTRSIPKLIAFTSNGQEVFTWGPRPFPAQQIMLDWKASHGLIGWEQFEQQLHSWYANDKGLTTQNELMSLLLKHSI